MGLLEQVIGNVLGGAMSGGRGQGGGGLGDILGGALGGGQAGRPGGQGRGGLSPIVMAILALIAGKALSGGLGGMFGPSGGRAPQGGGDDGGFGDAPAGGGGDVGDISGGMYPGGQRGPGPQIDTGGDMAADPRGGDGGGMAGLPGGLDGLIDMFRRNGQGGAIDSWIGSGPNQQISPEELGQALDDRTIDTLERQTGLPRGDLLGQLAEVLPSVIDQLSPKGRRPTADEQGQW